MKKLESMLNKIEKLQPEYIESMRLEIKYKQDIETASAEFEKQLKLAIKRNRNEMVFLRALVIKYKELDNLPDETEEVKDQWSKCQELYNKFKGFTVMTGLPIDLWELALCDW